VYQHAVSSGYGLFHDPGIAQKNMKYRWDPHQ